MNKLENLPFFKISDKESINRFTAFFLHAWHNMYEMAELMESLYKKVTSITEQDEDILEEKKKKLEKMLEIKPEERKSASILTSMLEKILEHCLGNHSIYIYFAEYYDDRCFRDIYSIYYASKHFAPPRTCSRFFLFDGGKIETIEDETNLNEAFIGTIVRRPLKGREIGRTLVDPRYLYETKNNGDLKCNIWRNKYKITMFGIPLEVWAFPYCMQDGEVSTCAETTILNIMDYYSHRYPDYKRIFPSDISKIVHANSNVTNLPSRGLSYEMVSKVFLEYGFSPILYSAKNFKNKFADILHSYVASGIPVALGINNGENEEIGHSVIVIGTQARLIDTDKENRIKAFKEAPILRLPDNSRDISHYLTLKGAIDSSYIIMDDGRAPYSSAKIYEDNGEVFLQYLPTDEEKWKIAIFAVPMGQEMAMDADAAISCFRSLLVDDVFGYSDYIHRLKVGIPEKRDARSALAGRSFRLKRDTRCKKLLTAIKNLLTVPVGIREHCGAGKIGGAHRGRGKEGKSFPRERFAGFLFAGK